MKKQLLLIAALVSASMALQAMDRKQVNTAIRTCAGTVCQKTSNVADWVADCCSNCKRKCEKVNEYHDTTCTNCQIQPCLQRRCSGPIARLSEFSRKLCAAFACWTETQAVLQRLKK